ncbi:MAG: hypothetical protein KH335_10475, partial [Coprococcus sp.]|nr:hypothetical protein [Coprococcus sp.]
GKNKMDATCTIQDSIHVFSLVHKYVSRILGTYQDDVIVQVPIFNYKYYTVFDKNNKKLDLVGSVNNCVTFKVPPRYNRTLIIGFREPISWRISEIISAIGFIVALFIGIKLLVAKRRKNIR